MARRFAQVHTDIWEDDDFLALGPDARFVFIACFAQKIVNYCGVMVYSPARMVRATALTPKQVARAVDELHERRFIFHDADTGEVLVRSFIRNNGVMKQSQLRKAMERTFGDILSEPIRALVLAELGPDYVGPARKGAAHPGGPARKGAAHPASQPDGQGDGQADGEAAGSARITGSVVATDSYVTGNPEQPSSPLPEPAAPETVAAALAASRRGLHAVAEPRDGRETVA